MCLLRHNAKRLDGFSALFDGQALKLGKRLSILDQVLRDSIEVKRMHDTAGLVNEPYNVRDIRAAEPVRRRSTERGEMLNPENNIDRDQPPPGASPLRIIVCYPAAPELVEMVQWCKCP